MTCFGLSLVLVLYSCDSPNQDEEKSTFPSPQVESIETTPLSNERYIHRIAITLLGRPCICG